MRSKSLLLILASILIWVPPSLAQYMFMDTDGDGIATAKDALQYGKVNRVSIWLVTDRDRKGNPIRLASGAKPLSVFSYEVSIGAVGGAVEWGTYTNAKPEMNMPFGRRESTSEIYLGYAGFSPLPPGKYNLGTLEARILSGAPRLEFLTRSHIYGGGMTSFGSANPGRDGDHTLKFGTNTAATSPPDAEPADWHDADGLNATVSIATANSLPGEPLQAYSIRIITQPGSGSCRLRLTLRRSESVHVSLFDVRGRQVLKRSFGDLAAGTHDVDLSEHGDRLPSGIYMYRVATSQGVQRGRVALVR